MKIWFFNHYAVPPNLYPLARTYNFAKCLLKRGHLVTIFAASTVHNSDVNLITDKKKYVGEIIDGIDYIYIRTSNYKTNGLDRIINMIQYTYGLFKITKNFDTPDVIVASSAHHLACIAGIKIAEKFKCECVIEITDLWPETFVAYNIIKKNNPILKLLYVMEKWVYKKAGKLVFSMEGGREYIIDKKWDTGNKGPIDLDKVYHINNGVDLEAFKYNKNHYVFDDDDLSKDRSYKIIYIGSLREANDSIWRLLEMAELFKTKGHEDIKFLIYGKGSEKEKMEEYCIDKNLDNVKIKGYVDKKYIPYILSCCDLNILNCSSWSVLKYGGSQNKLFDYLASGNPIISGETSKYSIINNYNCGISRKYENTEDLMEAILQMKNLDDESKSHMNKNILKIAKEYDYDNLTQKLIRVIENGERKN